MSEFELHNLITAARAEFDLATLAMFLVSMMFIFLSRSTRGAWRERTPKWLMATYTITAALIFLRTLASIVRFGKLNLLLQQSEPQFMVTYIPLQMPTAILRLGFFIFMFCLTLHFIRLKKLA